MWGVELSVLGVGLGVGCRAQLSILGVWLGVGCRAVRTGCRAGCVV